VDARLKAEVRGRAGARCEYCQFPEAYAELRFQINRTDAVLVREALMEEGVYLAKGPKG
jgi:hypothetical protein